MPGIFVQTPLSLLLLETGVLKAPLLSPVPSRATHVQQATRVPLTPTIFLAQSALPDNTQPSGMPLATTVLPATTAQTLPLTPFVASLASTPPGQHSTAHLVLLVGTARSRTPRILRVRQAPGLVALQWCAPVVCLGTLALPVPLHPLPSLIFVQRVATAPMESPSPIVLLGLSAMD